MTTKLFRVADMVAAEQAADKAGWSYDKMMETAGRRVAEAVMERWEVDEAEILVLVGPGNNGGDGLVAGRYLAENGARVGFYLTAPRDPASDENLRLVEEIGLDVLLAEHDQRYRVLRHRLRQTEIVVDALLGTGVSRPIRDPIAGVLKQVRVALDERQQALDESMRPAVLPVAALSDGSAPYLRATSVIAVDCPSGLSCDSGELDPLAIDATLTVTFAGPKRGHFRFPGAASLGELVVADIGIDPALPEVARLPVTLATPALARSLFPERPLDGHKGTFGTALIAAGSAGYWGAPVLAARGALRAGAGLVALVVPQAIRPTVAGQLPEATYPDGPDEKTLGEATARQLASGKQTYAAALIGPGLGDARGFVDALLTTPDTPPLVIDADGLNVLASLERWVDRVPAHTVLTPHPGEMARLMNVPLATVREADRVQLALDQAAAWGTVVVLKGAYTVVASPDGVATLIPFANPALGAGGSGDVLAGIIVALLAQGLSALRGSCAGGLLARCGRGAGGPAVDGIRADDQRTGRLPARSAPPDNSERLSGVRSLTIVAIPDGPCYYMHSARPAGCLYAA